MRLRVSYVHYGKIDRCPIQHLPPDDHHAYYTVCVASVLVGSEHRMNVNYIVYIYIYI
jgi:hypothetical protein